MQPSSLIFLVLIAIWAVYLLQHWVRRREHLATARSVDRFSDAMRVLERRRPLSEVDLTAPRHRSYVFSPARPSQPEVVVKRPHFLKPQISTDRASVRPTRIFHVLAGMSARRLRGLSLLAVLALTLIIVPLAAFSVLSPWSLLVVVLLLGADVAWLRLAAVSERAMRREGAQGQESEEDFARPGFRRSTYFEFESESESAFEAETATGAEAAPETATGAETAPEFAPEAETAPETATGAQTPSGAAPEAEPGTDLAAQNGTRTAPHTESAPVAKPVVALQSAEAPEPSELPFEADPSGWAPVPVPPPTYTLKAKAADPVYESAAVYPPAPTGPWTLDGLEYDCELDELVERRSAAGA